MIEIVLVIAASMVFLLPAAVLPARRAMAQRQAQQAEAQEEQRAARQRQEDAAQAERQRIHDLWQDHPDLGGLTEWLRYYHHRRERIDREQAEAEAYLKQREDEVEALAVQRGGEQVPAGHRFLVLVALVMFAVVVGLGIALDYLIFRGLHPHAVLLPLGLACLAVFGIMTGSIIFFGAGRHKLLPDSVGDYAKLALRLFGLVLAGGVILYMTNIAPYRSAAAGQASIDRAVSTLQNDRTAVPPAPPIVLAQDQQAVTRARARLKEAQLVDQLSAATLAFLEIPLTEGAVLGAELLAFDWARRRRDQAKQAVQEITGEGTAAQAQFVNDLVGILVARGHDENQVRLIMARVQNLNLALAGQASVPNTLPAGGGGPGSAAPGGPAPGGGPGGGGPGPGSGSLPGMPAGASGGPPITNVDPAAGPTGMAPVTLLAPEERNHTQ